MTTGVLDLFRLNGRHALIAGGAGLLGPMFAEALLEAGARVTILDLNGERLASCQEELGRRFAGRITVQRCDLTDEPDVEKAAQTAEAIAPVDILVNAAAMDPKVNGNTASTPSAGFTEYPAAQWRKALDVNLTGIYLITQAVCRRMEPRGRGIVVNISSTYGMIGPDQRVYQEGQPEPHFIKPADYTVSKAGLIGFTRYLAAYYAGRGIRVNCLSPGGVFDNHPEPFAKAYGSRTLLRRMARRDEYKGAIVFLCSEASSYMTGTNLEVDVGCTAL